VISKLLKQAGSFVCQFRKEGSMLVQCCVMHLQVEYSYPPLVDGQPVDSNEVPPEWKHLPSLALPDGAHNYTQGITNLINLMVQYNSNFFLF
jgi:hypothetical protein